MAKCLYCSEKATDTDALGLPACADHVGEADRYFESVTGYSPNEDRFLYCDEHSDMWVSGCPRCEECCQHHYGIPVEEMRSIGVGGEYV